MKIKGFILLGALLVFGESQAMQTAHDEGTDAPTVSRNRRVSQSANTSPAVSPRGLEDAGMARERDILLAALQIFSGASSHKTGRTRALEAFLRNAGGTVDGTSTILLQDFFPNIYAHMPETLRAVLTQPASSVGSSSAKPRKARFDEVPAATPDPYALKGPISFEQWQEIHAGWAAEKERMERRIRPGMNRKRDTQSRDDLTPLDAARSEAKQRMPEVPLARELRTQWRDAQAQKKKAFKRLSRDAGLQRQSSSGQKGLSIGPANSLIEMIGDPTETTTVAPSISSLAEMIEAVTAGSNVPRPSLGEQFGSGAY